MPVLGVDLIGEAPGRLGLPQLRQPGIEDPVVAVFGTVPCPQAVRCLEFQVWLIPVQPHLAGAALLQLALQLDHIAPGGRQLGLGRQPIRPSLRLIVLRRQLPAALGDPLLEDGQFLCGQGFNPRPVVRVPKPPELDGLRPGEQGLQGGRGAVDVHLRCSQVEVKGLRNIGGALQGEGVQGQLPVGIRLFKLQGHLHWIQQAGPVSLVTGGLEAGVVFVHGLAAFRDYQMLVSGVIVPAVHAPDAGFPLGDGLGEDQGIHRVRLILIAAHAVIGVIEHRIVLPLLIGEVHADPLEKEILLHGRKPGAVGQPLQPCQ